MSKETEVTIETINGGEIITKANQAIRTLAGLVNSHPEMFISRIKEQDGDTIRFGRAAVILEVTLNYELAPNGQIENLAVGCPVQIKLPKSAAEGREIKIKSTARGIQLVQPEFSFAEAQRKS